MSIRDLYLSLESIKKRSESNIFYPIEYFLEHGLIKILSTKEYDKNKEKAEELDSLNSKAISILEIWSTVSADYDCLHNNLSSRLHHFFTSKKTLSYEIQEVERLRIERDQLKEQYKIYVDKARDALYSKNIVHQYFPLCGSYVTITSKGDFLLKISSSEKLVKNDIFTYDQFLNNAAKLIKNTNYAGSVYRYGYGKPHYKRRKMRDSHNISIQTKKLEQVKKIILEFADSP